jgi:hypothetical protein
MEPVVRAPDVGFGHIEIRFGYGTEARSAAWRLDVAWLDSPPNPSARQNALCRPPNEQWTDPGAI